MAECRAKTLIADVQVLPELSAGHGLMLEGSEHSVGEGVWILVLIGIGDEGEMHGRLGPELDDGGRRSGVGAVLGAQFEPALSA